MKREAKALKEIDTPMSERELKAGDHAELIRRADDDRKKRPWRYYELDRETLLRMLDEQADQIAASQSAAPAREPQTWQPIDSAPDGEHVLVWLEPYGVIKAVRDGETWMSMTGLVIRPQLWQPLPSAPSPSPTPEAQG